MNDSTWGFAQPSSRGKSPSAAAEARNIKENESTLPRDGSYELPCYCQGTLEGEGVEVPVSALKALVRNLRQQITEMARDREKDKEMHEKLRDHYFSLFQKYQVLASSAEGEVVAGLEQNMTALESQKEALKKKIIDLMATHKRVSELRNAVHSSLVAKHESLSEKYTQLMADFNTAREAQKNLEPQKKELRDKFNALKVSIDI